jgi:hypothetical protein
MLATPNLNKNDVIDGVDKMDKNGITQERVAS